MHCSYTFQRDTTDLIVAEIQRRAAWNTANSLHVLRQILFLVFWTADPPPPSILSLIATPQPCHITILFWKALFSQLGFGDRRGVAVLEARVKPPTLRIPFGMAFFGLWPTVFLSYSCYYTKSKCFCIGLVLETGSIWNRKAKSYKIVWQSYLLFSFKIYVAPNVNFFLIACFWYVSYMHG